MIRLFLAIILALATFAQPSGSTACTDASAYADAPSALSAAQGTNKCLELPAGTYTLTAAGGDWLGVTTGNVEIRGAGEGKTIISTAGITLTQSLYVVAIHAPGAYVHDLTIQIGSGYHSSYEVGGVLAGLGAMRARIERVEVVGGYGGGGGNGFGIGTYQPWDQAGGVQGVTIQDSWVRDSPTTGIGVNSSGNTISHNRVERVGITSLQHGFYVQGGNNLLEGNTIDSASGYSFHGYAHVPNINASGNRYIGNLSLNPGAGHMVLDGLANTANPEVPIGAPLDRYTVIQGNTFRNTFGHRSAGVWCNGVPCLIQSNTLEDIFPTAGGGWIDDNAGSIITNNILNTTGIAPDGAVNYSMIKVSGTLGATVSNNRLTNGQYGGGITMSGARHSITNNTVLLTGSGSQGLTLSGDMLLVTGNRIESTAGAYVMSVTLPLTNLTFTGNYLKRTGDLCNLNLSGVTGRIALNMFDGVFRYSGAAPGLIQ